MPSFYVYEKYSYVIMDQHITFSGIAFAFDFWTLKYIPDFFIQTNRLPLLSLRLLNVRE